MITPVSTAASEDTLAPTKENLHEIDNHNDVGSSDSSVYKLPSRLRSPEMVQRAYDICQDRTLQMEMRLDAIRALKTTGHQHFDRTLEILQNLKKDSSPEVIIEADDVIRYIQETKKKLFRPFIERKIEADKRVRERLDNIVDTLSKKDSLSDSEKKLLEITLREIEADQKRKAILRNRILRLEDELGEMKKKERLTKEEELQMERLNTKLNKMKLYLRSQ